MKNRDDFVIANIMRYLADTHSSQATLARKAKIDPVNLNRIIKGKRGAGAEIAQKLADAMGITLGQLYSELSETPAPHQDRASKIGEISILLPSLNDLELENILSAVKGSPSILARGLGSTKIK